MTKPILDFEQPIVQLEEKIAEMREIGKAIDLRKEIAELERRTDNLRKEIYSNLTRWQRIQIARHPLRPNSVDFIKNIFTDFIELSGDRVSGNDASIIGGIAKISGISVVVLGNRKTKDKKTNLYKPAQIPSAEGFRKATRLMKLAERMAKPVISLIDVPYNASYPENDDPGLANAISNQLAEMSVLQTPTISVVIGEGASATAMALSIADRLLMLENSWFSIVSPEKAAETLWGSLDFKEQAAEAMKPIARDLLNLSLIDDIVPEPVGGAHRNHKMMFEILKKKLIAELKDLRREKIEKLLKKRHEKFFAKGVWRE
ncbi:MAG TPA: acetyl-CoA carboxylase carboxyltransferase subunit alpha [Candidatus Kapabacteria bacterium]|nr:acetyl-CoA carboxylase carboxyltransferase subunit alpha [Candidatus Kapabacteria bacterium]HOQ48264.1 acetyl-CoA carboxylase carboxyltransferase subunit alpha [Candidatus Kapabacteria bacterium]HPU22811.1 acetyl-CoA carboxylase carboxyltransferase subunit alpha [Candidatus Kapabacteria bacterium]